MQLAKREWRPEKWRGLLGAAAVGLVLGVLGPFGSQTTLTTGVKYAFWLGLSLAGFAAVAATARILPATAAEGSWAFRIATLAAVSAVPMTFIVAWAMGAVRPGRTFGAVQLLGLYPFVALVQALIAGAIQPGRRLAPPLSEAEVPVAAEYPAELLGKLPAGLGRDVLALEAEDHYLRVHTRHGSALVLMRLADATAMIDPRLGLRVHRSWWVAKDGVKSIERGAGRTSLLLHDGREVPVSRTYLPAVRTALAG